MHIYILVVHCIRWWRLADFFPPVFSIFRQVLPIVQRDLRDPQFFCFFLWCPYAWVLVCPFYVTLLYIECKGSVLAVPKSFQVVCPSKVALGECIVHVREFIFVQEEFICDMLPPLDISYFAQETWSLWASALYTVKVSTPYRKVERTMTPVHTAYSVLWRGLCWVRFTSSIR